MITRGHPKKLWANGLWNHFTKRKRYTIVCCNCSHTWSEKVPFLIDQASAVCPACGCQNMWMHSHFERDYDAARKATP